MFKRQCVGQCNSTESDAAILVFGALMNPCKEAGYVLDDQDMTEKRHDTQVVWQFAHQTRARLSASPPTKVPRMRLREKSHDKGVRLLIKHCEFRRRCA
jgi:hypothetical protein